MIKLTEIGRSFLQKPHLERATPEVAMHFLNLLDDLRKKHALHVESTLARQTRRIRMEQHALRLHISFLTSVVCRGFLRREGGRDHDALATRARCSFVETMQAFLDLQSLTIVPLRSWSMIHAGISSALLLELYGNQEQTVELKRVRNRFLNVLSSDRSGGDDAADSDNQPWLCASHLKALNVLRNSITDSQAQAINHGATPKDSRLSEVNANQPFAAPNQSATQGAL